MKGKTRGLSVKPNVQIQPFYQYQLIGIRICARTRGKRRRKRCGVRERKMGERNNAKSTNRNTVIVLALLI